MDTVWLAEAYPWWRKHQMEARGSTVVSALMARETDEPRRSPGGSSRRTRGTRCRSRWTRASCRRRPARDASSSASAPRRSSSTTRSRAGRRRSRSRSAHMRDSVEIVRGILGGDRFEYDGKVFSADIPALSDEAHTPRWDVPVYVAGTAPMMQQLGGEIGDGLLTPSITTPDYVRYTAGNIREGAAKSGRDRRTTSTSAARSSPRSTRPTATPAATAHARSAACTSPTRCRTSRARPTCCSTAPGSTRRRSAPSRRRWSTVGVSPRRRRSRDALLDKCKPIAGTPTDCIEAIEEYRDAGCTHIMLELWGDEPSRADPALRREGAPALPRGVT